MNNSYRFKSDPGQQKKKQKASKSQGLLVLMIVNHQK